MPDPSSLLVPWIPQVSEALVLCAKRCHSTSNSSICGETEIFPTCPHSFYHLFSLFFTSKQKSQHLGFPKSYKGLEIPSERRLSDSHPGYPGHGSVDFMPLNQESLQR